MVGLASSLFVLLLFTLNAATAVAAPLSLSGDDFDPGRIIDDDVMVNHSTMTADEIQTFLEDNVEGGECEREPDPGSPTCFFEYQENPETGENNYGLFDDDGLPAEVEGASTAAEIIWQAAQDHLINPQVLLVLIQKEQGLVTDNDPWLRQFEKATGYHCPDGAPCSEAAAGLYRQASQAAWQLRRYLDHSEDYWYAIGENLIFYHPRTSCGQGVVDVQNKATIALYLYTPYTPNEAALNNLFGQGDSCSSYGNRNFWSYFHRWFGSPTSGLLLPTAEEEEESPSWTYEVSYQGVFEDETQSAALFSNSNRMSPGQTLYVVLDFKNTGSSTWSRDEGDAQVSLFAQGQSLWLCHDSWLNGCEQPALLEQERVEPGQTGSFEFWVMAPEANGLFTVSFSPFNLDNHLNGTAADFIFELAGASEDADLSQPAPLAPAASENEEEDSEESPAEEDEEETDSTEVAVVPDGVAVLPDDWDELSPIEKLLLNPWGCHDTTQIRADNGRCLSGGYTVPDSNQVAEAEEDEEDEEETDSTEVAVVPDGVAVVPDDWDELSPIEKLLLNPWGCHDTTQIRADNGRCLSGGYTVPDSNQVAEAEEDEEDEEETDSTEVAVVPDGVAVLPDDWDELSPIEKLLLNPWGCHDTTQIRADNGRCLSGGYTVPDSNQVAEAEEDEEDEEETDSTEVAVVPDGVAVLPDDWDELSPIEKLLLNPWGCHDTTQIRADNGRCLSGGYTVPDSNQVAEAEEDEEDEEETDSTEVAVVPDDWDELSPIEKLLLNPWGCHDTTQIRADNGRCLSGGYTVPDSNQVAEAEEDEEDEEETDSTEVAVVPDGVAVLPDDWDELSPIEKLLLNPWGCHDTTQIRADNGRCLSGGYTVPDSNQV